MTPAPRIIPDGLEWNTTMNERIKQAIIQAVTNEPLVRTFKMKLVDLGTGYSRVEMIYDPSIMDNIYARAHGGAIYSLMDEAFETAGQTDGTIAVALNVNVTYIASPEPGKRLIAEARLTSETKKTAGYGITVREEPDRLIATCQALAFRTGKPIPFL